MSDIVARYRRNADRLTLVIAAVPADRWSSPTPCEGWDARGVVAHLVDTSALFLGFIGVGHEPAVAVADDPLAAWTGARDAVLRVLDDPDVATTAYQSPFGSMVFETSADRFLTADLVLHAWDLARATGVDHELPADEVAHLTEQLRAMETEFGAAFRGPSTFGPALPAPADATPAEALLAFAGRDPRWTP